MTGTNNTGKAMRENPMKKMEWTEPFQGIQHLLGLLSGFEITMEVLSSESALVYVLRQTEVLHPMVCLHSTIGVSLEEARKIGEEWGQALQDEGSGLDA